MPRAKKILRHRFQGMRLAGNWTEKRFSVNHGASRKQFRTSFYDEALRPDHGLRFASGLH